MPNIKLGVNVQNPITSFGTATFSTYDSLGLEIFLTVTSENILKKKQPPSFHENKLSIFINYFC